VVAGEAIAGHPGTFTTHVETPAGGVAIGVAPTGEFVVGDGQVVRFSLAPTAVGEPTAVDRGDGVVAVAQTFELGDGTQLRVGVSSPLQPVTDGLDALRALLWIGIPLLTAAVAVITWLAATRALRPVHAITVQAQAISASNLADRVPVPASRDEVHDLATTVNEMLGRLDTSHRRQRQFVADASHELRSPVAASRVQLEVALANPDAADWPTTAEAVLTEQRQLGRLVDDLLALGRLDEDGIGTTVDVDFDELVVQEAARSQRVPVVVVACEPVRLLANPQLLTRVVRNVIDNAARHAATEVRVELRASAGRAELTVDDDGHGVAPAERERIFERFTRLDEARTRNDGGAGLGLAIAREVARAHGGDVICEAAPMGGARLVVTLPMP
jgi:signal transduction histidine kinase